VSKKRIIDLVAGVVSPEAAHALAGTGWLPDVLQVP
jgi:hypothetical protein